MKSWASAGLALCLMVGSLGAGAESANGSLSKPANGFLRDAAGGYSAEAAYQLQENWTLPRFLTVTPEGAYSYLHLATQLPHATIYRQGPVVPLVSELDPRLGQLPVEWQGKQQTLDEVILSPQSPLQGVIVMHRGKVVYEQYPGMRPFDNHVWMSNAKPVASYLIAQLEGEGRLDVEQPVVRYLPAAAGTHWENIKVIDVLNMQTGLDLVENAAARANPMSGFSRFMVAEVGYPNREGEVLTHNEALLSVGYLGEPGQKFEYSSANTQLLGLIIESITGQRLADVISERVWRPIGAEGDAQLALSPQGNGIIHGLISSRLVDMARFAMLYTPSWHKVSEQRLVSAASLEKIRTAGNPAAYYQGEMGPRLARLFGERPVSNAYQWDAIFADGDMYKGGMNGQGLYVSPDKDLVVAWFGTGFAEVPMERLARTVALTRPTL
ncbi:beta-lactamase family protein [Aestuariicella hydrocarbonica]|uniref:Beta-lactamase family protein n=1 Tax=Pseudomaricurvus hydrocarbonicus TaxID=1470433 RepID=A0A9E5JT13_9GAMM|nr:serine hydrolase domain-containing protein [Aestuariicella hydrocarbonica]NHO66312.1 beta-lactamase family protein [Aestuariicella hydrocarbonica]